MRANKPLEKVYINFQIVDTKEEGEGYVLFAIDDYSQYLFPPVTGSMEEDIQQRLDALVKCYNSTRENFDPKIHSKKTTYIVNLPEEFLMLFQSFVRQPDTVELDPIGVEYAFEPVFEMMFKDKD